MKIALISPKGPLYRYKGGIFRKSLRYQPLTLTTLAALVPAELNAELMLIDESIEEISEDLDVDLVAMTVISGTAPRSYELAEKFRRRGIIVVLGGPHVTLMPEEASEHADAICTGYAEESWPQLLRDFARDALRPRYQQSPTFSLQNLPPECQVFPRRDLLDNSKFLTHAVFEATRSCMHNCDFCVAPTAWGRSQFQRPVDWVIEDIRRVGHKKIIFIDLNLTGDTRYARELLTAMVPLKVRWFGLSTVLITLDPELVQLMARSGCMGVLLGLETLSQASLGDAGKKFNRAVDYADAIRTLHRHGIYIYGCFVFGLDNDTPSIFDETVEFALQTGIDLPRFSVLTPFPGTPLFQQLESEGRILHRNWEKYDGQHVVYQPRNMSPEELAEGHERAWKQVYKWQSIARRLWKARNYRPLALSVNIGYRFYAHNLHRYYTCDWQVDAFPSRPAPLEEERAPDVTG